MIGLTECRKEELRNICRRMQSVSNTFYSGAVGTGNHAFIEFCGLMNEYIKACFDSIEQGVDFTNCNVHSGIALPLAPYQLDYIREKFDCIYSGSFKIEN